MNEVCDSAESPVGPGVHGAPSAPAELILTTFALDLDSLARTTGLCTGSVVSWRDAHVPLHERGVSLGWLYDFVRSVDRSWQDVVRNHERASRASFHFDHVPEPDPLPFAETVEMTPAFLVPNVIRPLTAIIKGPLFALVPAEHRGRPDLFVSHSWSNPLTTGSAFSTLAALDSPLGGGPVKRVWLDVACYNQHRVERIAADMESVVASIGQVGLPMINAVPFTRLWCLCGSSFARTRQRRGWLGSKRTAPPTTSAFCGNDSTKDSSRSNGPPRRFPGTASRSWTRWSRRSARFDRRTDTYVNL